MELIGQTAALAVITATACLVVRQKTGELALVLSLAGITMILLTVLPVLSPVMDVFMSLKTLAGISDEILGPVIKISAFGILTQITGAVCEDAGEKTLRQVVELAGNMLSLYAGLPLLSSVIDLLEETLRP